MVLHFGHLVQSPSGISRFFDLDEDNLGFFAKVALPVLGGGVTAGSMVSVPSDFFVNEVVAMISKFEVCQLNSSVVSPPAAFYVHQASSYSLAIS